MALPKYKVSKARSMTKRRANEKRTLHQINECPECGEFKLSHRVCPSCGMYKGRTVIRKDQ